MPGSHSLFSIIYEIIDVLGVQTVDTADTANPLTNLWFQTEHGFETMVVGNSGAIHGSISPLHGQPI